MLKLQDTEILFLTEEDESLIPYSSFKNEFGAIFHLCVKWTPNTKNTQLSLYRPGSDGYKLMSREFWPEEINNFIAYERLEEK